MCDSDDNYFSDDWVLDDKTLAVLDEEESKFKHATSTQTRKSAGPPPSKRQKTTGPWQSQSVTGGTRCTSTLEDMEDFLPDISVRRDGTYDIRDRQIHPSGPPGRSEIALGPGPNVVMQAGSGTQPTAAAPAPRGSAPVMHSTGPARVTQVSSRPPSSARGTRTTQSPASSQDISRVAPGPPLQVSRVPSAAASGGYVDQLLQQIDELQKKNEAIQVEVESAREAKFAKEGEVTILRKRLEKTAQEHLAQVVKLKTAKEEADAKHVLLQKQFEVDKERLRTELTFRHHELETTSRKHTPAVLPKNDASQTAEPLPTQRQKPGQRGSAAPSMPLPETPRRPRFGIISDFENSKKTPVLETHLPSGFQTRTTRSQFMEGRKGKATTSSDASQPPPPPVPDTSLVSQESGTQFFQPIAFSTPFDVGGPVEDVVPQVDVAVDDIHMMDEGTPVMVVSSQENITLALPSWNLIVHDIMLTHKIQGSELPTLQLLVCAAPTDTCQVKSYGAALMRIFDALGGIPAHPDRDFDDLARVICCALCEITELLAKNNLITTLTAVLNLLTKLAYMSPSTRALLSLQRVPDHDETPHVLGVLHSIVRDQLQQLDVTTGNEPPELCSLGKETLALFEALVWWIPDDLEDSLSTCPSMPYLLTALLHPHRPLWFLTGSMRLLTWLSTRRSLSRLLLSQQPASAPTGSSGEPVGAAHHPQIGLVCSLLTDTDRQGPEADELKSHIIAFFGMLSNIHPDVYTLLVESQELIPSIVLYLCHLAAPIWGANEIVFDDPLTATRSIHIMNHAMLLLHHLVIGEDATLDLRERLLHARAEPHQVLIHSFIPTFGRLSYANPPYWLDAKDRQKLLSIGALARALLERVIQGPELDLIWETYQDEGEESNEARMDIDDEEAEAQIIANS